MASQSPSQDATHLTEMKGQLKNLERSNNRKEMLLNVLQSIEKDLPLNNNKETAPGGFSNADEKEKDKVSLKKWVVWKWRWVVAAAKEKSLSQKLGKLLTHQTDSMPQHGSTTLPLAPSSLSGKKNGHKLERSKHILAKRAMNKIANLEKKVSNMSISLGRIVTSSFLSLMDSRPGNRLLSKSFSQWKNAGLKKNHRYESRPALPSCIGRPPAPNYMQKLKKGCKKDERSLTRPTSSDGKWASDGPYKIATCTTKALNTLQASLQQELQELQFLLSREMQALQISQVGFGQNCAAGPSNRGEKWKGSLTYVWGICNNLAQFLSEARDRLGRLDHKASTNFSRALNLSESAVRRNKNRESRFLPTSAVQYGDRGCLPRASNRRKKACSQQNAGSGALRPDASQKHQHEYRKPRRLESMGRKMLRQPGMTKTKVEGKFQSMNTRRCVKRAPQPHYKDPNGTKQTPNAACATLELLGDCQVTVETSTHDSNAPRQDEVRSTHETKGSTKLGTGRTVVKVPGNCQVTVGNSPHHIRNEVLDKICLKNYKRKCIAAQHAAQLQQEIERLRNQQQNLEAELKENVDLSLHWRPPWRRSVRL